MNALFLGFSMLRLIDLSQLDSDQSTILSIDKELFEYENDGINIAISFFTYSWCIFILVKIGICFLAQSNLLRVIK
ncbi:hypothetical protein A1356_20735 [Methylomonas koyamae]|uniref:Uncharacterized protein n=1 Tax=Methylomonas koyamae TaxID=702114 RepID=A0AA91I2Z7_9GAMM|nr:hypothetical protein A1356_20735 [Methylomonas koyamae]